MSKKHCVYLGVGSNLGNKRENIDKALSILKERTDEIINTSSFYETDPIGGPIQDKILNGALQIITHLAPHDLMRELQNIEKTLGRTKTVRNGPRSIDLDILLYDDLTINDKDLTIPHPRMFEREFVLKPLKEIMSEKEWKWRILPNIKSANLINDEKKWPSHDKI